MKYQVQQLYILLKNNKICAIDINDYIWGQARKLKELKPYHLTRNANY